MKKFSTKEISKVLKIPFNTVRGAVEKGLIQATKNTKGQWLIAIKDAEKYFSAPPADKYFQLKEFAQLLRIPVTVARNICFSLQGIKTFKGKIYVPIKEARKLFERKIGIMPISKAIKNWTITNRITLGEVNILQRFQREKDIHITVRHANRTDFMPWIVGAYNSCCTQIALNLFSITSEGDMLEIEICSKFPEKDLVELEGKAKSFLKPINVID